MLTKESKHKLRTILHNRQNGCVVRTSALDWANSIKFTNSEEYDLICEEVVQELTNPED